MATNLYADGLGGTVDHVVTNKPFYGLDSVAWYVHFATGVDGLGQAGRDKQKPLKTLARAVQNATPNDVIVLLDGHDEVLTATQDVTKAGLMIVGCGQTAGVPNVRLRLDSATGNMIQVAAASVQLRNLRFGPNVQLNASDKINVSGQSGFVMEGCYVELGVNDYAGLNLTVSSNYATIRDCTFISVATVAGPQPFAAVESSGAIQGLTIDGLVISDGTIGFANHYGLELSAAASTNMSCRRLSLVLGASARLGVGATGYVIPTVSGGGAIDV